MYGHISVIVKNANPKLCNENIKVLWTQHEIMLMPWFENSFSRTTEFQSWQAVWAVLTLGLLHSSVTLAGEQRGLCHLTGLVLQNVYFKLNVAFRIPSLKQNAADSHENDKKLLHRSCA